MNKFLLTNKHKLKSLYIRIALTFSGLAAIILVTAHFTGNLPEMQLLLIIFLTSAIGIPLFLIILGYLGWLLNFRKRSKAFSKTPFNQLKNIGFYNSYKNTNTKWSFIDEIKEGKINSYTLIMDISNVKSHTVEVEVPTEWKKLDKSEYSRLSEKFKQHNIEFRIGSLVKQYNTKKLTVHTISDLKKELEQFTELLKQEGFVPKNKNIRI